MAFEATKRELGELYTFFRLLADGKVFPGTPDAQRDDRKYWPVALIQREEHDGTRRYYIGEEDVRIVSGTVETVSYTHLRAHETGRNLVCRLLLEKKKKKKKKHESYMTKTANHTKCRKKQV